MPVKVLEAGDDDVYRIFEITSLAFGNEEPFWNATWPKHWTEAGRQAGTERFKQIAHNDTAVTLLKAEDESSGKILGMAKWNVYSNHMPNFDEPDGKQGDHWDSEDEKEYQRYLSHHFFATRRDAIFMSKGNVVCLDILAVDPIYQRQGVGAALVEWGTNKADELGVETVVESSKYGKGLYEKHGFNYVKQVEIQVPQKWAHVGGQEFAWLIRPSKLR